MNDLSLDRRSGRALLPLLALAALLMVGCTPGGPDSESDLGMVVTSSIPGADYAGLLTFAMADSVLILDVDDSTAEPIDPTYNEVIIEELRAQMVAAGFQDVSPDTATVTPDVWLVCGAVQSEVWYYCYDYGYGYWWGYYPPPADGAELHPGHRAVAADGHARGPGRRGRRHHRLDLAGGHQRRPPEIREHHRVGHPHRHPPGVHPVVLYPSQPGRQVTKE